MIAKHHVARAVGVIVTLAFVVGVSLGAYADTGSWLTVAVIWGFVGGCACIGLVLSWAINNWNAE